MPRLSMRAKIVEICISEQKAKRRCCCHCHFNCRFHCRRRLISYCHIHHFIPFDAHSHSNSTEYLNVVSFTSSYSLRVGRWERFAAYKMHIGKMAMSEIIVVLAQQHRHTRTHSRTLLHNHTRTLQFTWRLEWEGTNPGEINHANERF